jgi:thiamine pyrophosphokinase
MGPKVLGVLAGRDMPAGLLKRWAESADVVIAADAGADLLLEVGVPPHKVVGDLDSTRRSEEITRMAGQDVLQLIHDPSAEFTDCDKLLDAALADGYEALTLAAIEGDQLDHMLASLMSAARSPLCVRAALRTGVGWVLRDGESARVPTRPDRRVSLLPLTRTEGVSLRGVEWPLERSELSPLGHLSISNRATGDLVEARVLEGAALLFVEFPDEEMPLW